MSEAIVSEAIVVVNAGSTSLKFAAYAVDASRSLPSALPRRDREYGKRSAFCRHERGRQAIGRA